MASCNTGSSTVYDIKKQKDRSIMIACELPFQATHTEIPHISATEKKAI
jgi:hypothetical protein